MNIDKYIQLQSDWIKAEYLADYRIDDYPAISFESWKTSDQQLKIINRGRKRPIHWIGETSAADRSRILYYPDSKFYQLWVQHKAGNYRSIAINFLRKQFGVKSVQKKMHADHLVPRSRLRKKFPNGVTVIYFIPSQVNTSWGGGYEKTTQNHSIKIRSGITLLSVAKSMGTPGPSKSKMRTFRDISQELIKQGIFSKVYDDDKYYGTYDELIKVETELRAAANDITVKPLKGKPSQIIQSKTLLYTGEIKALQRNIPEKMDKLLGDSMTARRQDIIDAWIIANQKLDVHGNQEITLESIFELFLSNQEVFPLDRIVQLLNNVYTSRGAVAYLLDQTSVIGGWYIFAKNGIFQSTDYDWAN